MPNITRWIIKLNTISYNYLHVILILIHHDVIVFSYPIHAKMKSTFIYLTLYCEAEDNVSELIMLSVKVRFHTNLSRQIFSAHFPETGGNQLPFRAAETRLLNFLD